MRACCGRTVPTPRLAAPFSSTRTAAAMRSIVGASGCPSGMSDARRPWRGCRGFGGQPPSENHTETYIRAVADAVGIPDGQPLDTRDRTTMLRMAAAVSRVENGAAADMGEVELGWELFVRDKPASG